MINLDNRLKLSHWGNTEVWLKGEQVFKVEINYDEDCQSPRLDDNLGTFITFMNRYCSPDETDFKSAEDFSAAITSKTHLIIPVYAYSHGATVYNTEGFSCPWDSGHVGFIYVSKVDVCKEFGVKKVGSAIRRKVFDILRSEVSTYSLWANGNCYGYKVSSVSLVEVLGDVIGVKAFNELPTKEKLELWHEWIEIEDIDFEDLDSCWGYIETESSIREMYCYKEAMGAF